jgi:REP element-mobilizing transposase RayT
MKYDPDRHHRRSIRLKDYDYSQAGAYFVTICAHERRCLFGRIDQGEMRLNSLGMMVVNVWQDLNKRFPEVKTDACVVMPNHIHGIIWLVEAPLVGARDDDVRGARDGIRATTRVAPTLGLGASLDDGIRATTRVAPTLGFRASLDDGIRATTRVAPTLGFRASLGDGICATTRVAPTLGQVIGAFKSITTDQYIDGVKRCGWAPFPGRVWQRNYYEHVIRNDRSLNAIRNYIEANPSQWENDPENPVCNR